MDMEQYSQQLLSENRLGRGEICVANFIPPVNGTSLVSYFCVKNLASV